MTILDMEAKDDAKTISVGEIKATAVRIPHAGWPAPKRDWAAKRTDHAFPPYWFLTSPQGRYILEDDMNVANSIGVHVPLKIPADLKESGQDYFSILGETREIGE